MKLLYGVNVLHEVSILHILTVDTTHLLCDHDGTSTIIRSSDAWNGETVPKSCKIV